MITFEKKPDVMKEVMQIGEGRAIPKADFSWNKSGCSRNHTEATVAKAEKVRSKTRWEQMESESELPSRMQKSLQAGVRAVGFLLVT